MRLQSNPVFTQLTRNCKRPSMRVALWMSFGLGLLSLAVMTQRTLNMRSTTLGVPFGILFTAVWALTLFAPPKTLITAATLVSREMQNGLDDLLRLTPVSETTLMRGYTLTALYRLRGFLALVVGLMPILVLGTLQVYFAIFVAFVMAFDGPWYPSSDFAHFFVDMMLNAQYPSDLMPSIYVDYNSIYTTIFDRAIGFTILSVGLWGINWLAAVLGTVLTWRFRAKATPITFTALALPLATVATVALLSHLPSIEIGKVTFVLGMRLPALIASAIPYALSEVLMRSIGRWAKNANQKGSLCV